MIPNRVTSSGSVVVGEGIFGGAILIPGSGAGWGRAYLRLYDSATGANGPTLCELAASGDKSESFGPPIRVRYDDGIWDVITGTGASAIIYRD